MGKRKVKAIVEQDGAYWHVSTFEGADYFAEGEKPMAAVKNFLDGFDASRKLAGDKMFIGPPQHAKSRKPGKALFWADRDDYEVWFYTLAVEV